MPSARLHHRHYLAAIPMDVYGGEKDRNENKITMWVAGKTQDRRATALVDWSRKPGRRKHRLGRGLAKSGRTQATSVGSCAVGAEAHRPLGHAGSQAGAGGVQGKTRGGRSGREQPARCGVWAGTGSSRPEGSGSSARRPERAAPLNPCKQSFVPGPLPPRAPARNAPPAPAPAGSGR